MRVPAPRMERVARNRLGRDFVIGDVHGCFRTLEQCLAAVRFDPERDRLFSVTFDDIDMLRASHRRSIRRPSRCTSTIHAPRARSRAFKNASGSGGSRVIGSVPVPASSDGEGSGVSGSRPASLSSDSSRRLARYFRLTRQRASTDRY